MTTIELFLSVFGTVAIAAVLIALVARHRTRAVLRDLQVGELVPVVVGEVVSGPDGEVKTKVVNQ
jgi:hypothetical protein